MKKSNHQLLSSVLVTLMWLSPLLLQSTYAYSVSPLPSSKNNKVHSSSDKLGGTIPILSKVSSTTRSTAVTPISQFLQKGISTLSLAAAISFSSTVVNVPAAYADFDNFDTSSTATTTAISNNNASFDNAEDTVDNVIRNLKDATGDASKTFKVFENINDIITEGTGVGGSLSYTGVKLERGYVADEDTTIYNPGLSLLTESEKSSLINAILDNRKANIASNTWNQDNEYAFDFLKTRLDPLHMVELSSYLKVLPFLGGAMYLVALGVQQFARGIFEVAYVVSALVVFVPIFVLIAAGV